MLRWRQSVEYGELVKYYRGLIRLRKRLPGLCDKSASAAKRMLEQEILQPGAVAFRLDNRPGKDWKTAVDWPELFVVFNASDEVIETHLPQGQWKVLADGKQADCMPETSACRQGTVSAAPCSGIMLGLVPDTQKP